jgi:hypothetical protein
MYAGVLLFLGICTPRLWGGDVELRELREEGSHATYNNIARLQHSGGFDFDIVHEGSKGRV